jgi:hypothetical protein
MPWSLLPPLSLFCFFFIFLAVLDPTQFSIYKKGLRGEDPLSRKKATTLPKPGYPTYTHRDRERITGQEGVHLHSFIQLNPTQRFVSMHARLVPIL